MIDCWASIIGNCSDKMSKEHMVSKGLFKEDSRYKKGVITMYGLPWCENSPKEIGISSAQSKILCGYHNNVLSPLDSEAVKTFSIFRDIWDIIQHAKGRKINVKREIKHEINGVLLERWFLKTAIDILYVGLLKVDKPPRELVEIAYGIKKFPNGVGLCIAGKIGGQRIDSDDDLKFVPIIKNEDELVMCIFEFRGWKFVLPLIPLPIPYLLNFIDHSPSGYIPVDNFITDFFKAKVVYHIKDLEFKIGDNILVDVNFSWQSLEIDEIQPYIFNSWKVIKD